MGDSENGTSETSAKARPIAIEDKFSLLLDQMQQMNGNITRLLGGDDHILGADSDDAPDRGESASQDRAPAEAQQGGNKTLLKAIAQDLNLKEKTGPAIEGELAELVNALLTDKMSSEALKTKS